MASAGQHFAVADLTPEERVNLRVLRKRKADLINEIEQIKSELQNVEGELENLYYVDDSSKERQAMLIQGKKRFNADPDDGLEFLIKRGLVEQTPASVAAFLFQGEGLSKKAIGEYLGSNDPFNLQVLEEFVRLHDFQNLDLVGALRMFLWSFRLPGESQKIERMMAKFAEHFFVTQQVTNGVSFFDSPETAHVLSYSCIMLNTLLHNPAVKDKPSLDRFLAMNKESVQDHGVPPDIIAGIYDSIQKQPFKLPEDEVGRQSDPFIDPIREGWLYKQSSNQAFVVGPLMWKRRWFILADGCLFYFDNQLDRSPKGIIPIKDVGIRRVEAPQRPHMFEIFALRDEKIKACKTEQAGGRVFEGRHSNYRMCASSQEDLIGWIEAIANCLRP